LAKPLARFVKRIIRIKDLNHVIIARAGIDQVPDSTAKTRACFVEASHTQGINVRHVIKNAISAIK
jgi:hypothetical protein